MLFSMSKMHLIKSVFRTLKTNKENKQICSAHFRKRSWTKFSPVLWRGFGCILNSLMLELFYYTQKASIGTKEAIPPVWSVPSETLWDNSVSVNNAGEFWEQWMWASCIRTQDSWQGSYKDEEKLDFNTRQREKESKLHCAGYIFLFVVYSAAPFSFSTLFLRLSSLYFKAAPLRMSVAKKLLKRTALNKSFGVV